MNNDNNKDSIFYKLSEYDKGTLNDFFSERVCSLSKLTRQENYNTFENKSIEVFKARSFIGASSFYINKIPDGISRDDILNMVYSSSFFLSSKYGAVVVFKCISHKASELLEKKIYNYRYGYEYYKI